MRAPAASKTTSCTTPAPTSSARSHFPQTNIPKSRNSPASLPPTSNATPYSKKTRAKQLESSTTFYRAPASKGSEVIMNLSGRGLLRLSLLSAFTVLSSAAARADQQWTQPTPEELSMTSQKEVP